MKRSLITTELAIAIARHLALNGKQVDYFVPDAQRRSEIQAILGDTPNIRVLVPGQRITKVIQDPAIGEANHQPSTQHDHIVANERVPEEPEPCQSAMPFSKWIEAHAKWEARMAIRQRLLADADEAEGTG